MQEGRKVGQANIQILRTCTIPIETTGKGGKGRGGTKEKRGSRRRKKRKLETPNRAMQTKKKISKNPSSLFKTPYTDGISDPCITSKFPISQAHAN